MPEFELNLDELTEVIKNKITSETILDFSDVVNFVNSADREIFLSGIADGTGYYVDSYIQIGRAHV